jgi:hypothetical protein
MLEKKMSIEITRSDEVSVNVAHLHLFLRTEFELMDGCLGYGIVVDQDSFIQLFNKLDERILKILTTEKNLFQGLRKKYKAMGWDHQLKSFEDFINGWHCGNKNELRSILSDVERLVEKYGMSANSVIKFQKMVVDKNEGNKDLISKFSENLRFFQQIDDYVAKNRELAEAYIGNEFRFIEDTGEIFIGNKIVGEVEPGTEYYFFMLFLWMNIGRPVSYESIIAYVAERSDGQRKFNLTADAHCQKMKSEIKKEYFRAIDLIIKSGRTPEKKKGYKLLKKLKT